MSIITSLQHCGHWSYVKSSPCRHACWLLRLLMSCTLCRAEFHHHCHSCDTKSIITSREHCGNWLCIHCRAESTIIAALLHDVLDDTPVKAQQVEEQFGSDVVHMVAQVSQLSSMNQLLRRRRRQMVRNSSCLSSSTHHHHHHHSHLPVSSGCRAECQAGHVTSLVVPSSLHNRQSVQIAELSARQVTSPA